MYKKRSKKSISKFIFFILVLLSIIFSLVYFFRNITFKKLVINIDRIDCVDKKQIENIVSISNKNFLTYSFETEKQILEKKIICMKSANFKKSFPDKLTVDIHIRKPSINFFTAIESSSSAQNIDDIINPATDSAKISPEFSNSFVSDDEGVIFAKTAKDEIYKVNLINRQLKIGDKIDVDIIKGILHIFTNLNSLGINAWENYLNSKDFYIKGDSKIIVLNLNSKLNTQIASLQLILQKAKIDNENIEFIDLRFDKPVVKYGKR